MKILFVLILSCLLWICNYGQSGESYYKQGLECAQKGELQKAIALFDSSIDIKADEYVAWYNRGIVKAMMGHYEDALADMEQTIKLNAGYKKAYLNRGTAKKHLTDYAGAINDYSRALILDSTYAEAYFDRGLVYELFDTMELACADFNKAANLGYKDAPYRVARCSDTSTRRDHPILWLTKNAGTFEYGFKSQYPVKVGIGPDGGPENERSYLDLLRDAKGNPVRYYNIGTCCGYASANAPKGLALLDKYEISFTNENGETKTAILYLTFYDYDAPLILKGFRTVATP